MLPLISYRGAVHIPMKPKESFFFADGDKQSEVQELRPAMKEHYKRRNTDVLHSGATATKVSEINMASPTEPSGVDALDLRRLHETPSQHPEKRPPSARVCHEHWIQEDVETPCRRDGYAVCTRHRNSRSSSLVCHVCTVSVQPSAMAPVARLNPV